MNSEAAIAAILISILGSVATSFLAKFLINAKMAKSGKVKVRAAVNGKYINLFVGNNPSRDEIEAAIANAVQSSDASLRKSLLENIPHYFGNSFIPGLEEEWITLAESERLMGKYGEALSSLGHALSINPSHHGAWFQKGLTLSELDRLNEAIEAYQNAIKFNPGYVDALINLGIIFITLHRFDEADSALQKILLVEPGNTIAPQIKNLIRGH
jgi:tetratricopeptide (TPR) repeat protein